MIERAISKSQAGEGDEYEEIRYEGYGPGGVAVIVEAMTDNRNRTASTVRSTFGKHGGNLGETGSVSFMFERKGEIVDYFPEGMASLESGWKGEDHMDFTVAIAGQRIGGSVDIADDYVVIAVKLPFLLSFLAPKIEKSMRQEGTRLLA